MGVVGAQGVEVWVVLAFVGTDIIFVDFTGHDFFEPWVLDHLGDGDPLLCIFF